MQNPNGLRVLFLLAPAVFLVLPLSALIFILERISRAFVNTHLERDWRFGYQGLTLPVPSNSSTHSNASTQTIDVPNFNEGPPLAILGVSVWAFVAAVFSCCGIWELRRVEGSHASQRFWAWAIYISNLMTVGLGIGVLAWASALQARESWNPTQDIGTENPLFTRETIVCSIDKYFPQLDWAGPACGLAKATRFMLVPLVVASVLAMGSAWVLSRQRGGVRWLFGGKGRYAGFASVYEMGPPAQAPVYQYPPQFQPMPQQHPGPQQYGYGPQYQVPSQVYVPPQVQPGPLPAKDPATADRAVFR